MSLASVLFGLFGLSFFISKSGFTLFYSLAIIFGLVKYPWQQIHHATNLEKWMMTLFPLAILIGFFSLAGSTAAFNVMTGWTWPLIFFPLAYLHQHKKIQKSFIYGLGLSLFVACFFSYYRFYMEYDFLYNTEGRVSGFWDILRWSYFCAIAVTVLFAIFTRENYLKITEKKVVFLLLTTTSVSLLLSNSRGPWLGCLLGILVVMIVLKKTWKYFATFIFMVVLLLLSSHGVRDRLFSIFSVQKQGNEIISAHKSNASRLHMWKVAVDLYQDVPFFGVGFNESQPALESLIKSKGQDYNDKYTQGDFSYTDQHSSYLAMLLQFGGIYSAVLYSLFFMVTWLNRKDFIFMPAMLCTLFVYLFYASIVSFEATVGFGLVSWMILNLKKAKQDLQ